MSRGRFGDWEGTLETRLSAVKLLAERGWFTLVVYGNSDPPLLGSQTWLECDGGEIVGGMALIAKVREEKPLPGDRIFEVRVLWNGEPRIVTRFGP